MIADLKPYPKKKDSGVPWFGQVPEHWEVLPICAIARPRNATNAGHRELLSVYLGRGVIPFSAVEEKRTNPTSEDLSKYQAVEPGDFVLNNQQAWRGSVGVSKYKGIVSPAYLVLALNGQLHRDFADRLFCDRVMVAQYLVCSKGVGSIQRNLYWPHLRRVATLVPPVPEQAAIVRFLDHVDRRIRRYIRAKQKLIKLLEEQKQIIIHRAVTRGLDLNVRLKPSGVEWLGDVPAHWEILPIKRAFVSMDYGISESATETGNIRILTMGNIKNGRITIPESGGVPTVDDSLLLTPGDLLFNRTNSAELVGKVGLYQGTESSVTFASYLVRMRPRAGYEPEYLNLLLNDISILSIARREAIPSLHQSNLNPTRYGRLQISVPQSEEQRKILSLVRQSTFALDRAISRAEREIALLREYRARLIADVVTGKLDMREVAARLPKEAEELEPLADVEPDTDVEPDPPDELDAIPEETEA